MSHKDAPPETPSQIACREFWERAQPTVTRAWGRAQDGSFLAEESRLLHKAWEAASAPVGAAEAWQEGYRQGVLDERTSEDNIGIAGFGAKVEPARNNPYAIAQQTAAPSGEAWRQKAAAWLEAKAVEQEANNQRWPDHAAAYKEWRDRPGVLRYLAAQVLAAQQQGGRADG